MAKSLNLLCGIFCLATQALGVDQGKSVSASAIERWSIVGVISDDAQSGIAVLKNSENGRTFTVEVGESLPTDYGVVLHSVRDRKVVVKDGQGYHQLSFALPDNNIGEDQSALRPARFLDNYYRGFNETPLEIFGDGEHDGRDAKADPTGFSVPISNFGRLRPDFAPSRFELYRTENRYDLDDDADFVVSYDNFEEDLPTESGAGSLPITDGAATRWRSRTSAPSDELSPRGEYEPANEPAIFESPLAIGIRPLGVTDGSLLSGESEPGDD